MRSLVLASLFLLLAPDAKAACVCTDAAGNARQDAPVIVFPGPDQGVAVCGKVEKRNGTKVVGSGFVVKACGEKDALVELDSATQGELDPRADMLVVTRLESLPSGKNWVWETLPFLRYDIRVDEAGKAQVTKTLVLTKPVFPPKRINEVLAEYEQIRSGATRVSDDFPYKLLCAALAGNEFAAGKLPIMKEELHLEGPADDAATAALALFQLANEK